LQCLNVAFSPQPSKEAHEVNPTFHGKVWSTEVYMPVHVAEPSMVVLRIAADQESVASFNLLFAFLLGLCAGDSDVATAPAFVVEKIVGTLDVSLGTLLVVNEIFAEPVACRN